MRKIILLSLLILISYSNIANAVTESYFFRIHNYPIDDICTIKNKFIDLRIEKGLNYLYENQLPNGDFPVYLSLSLNMSHSSNANVPIVFDTGLILHTLNIADSRHTKELYEMKTKAIDFLLNNKESHSVWRFFGKNDYIPPDIDDTSVVFAALVESGVNISDESLDYMLNYRTLDGVFYVWINSEEWLNTSNPYYNKPEFRLNEIDPSVNTNALYAYSLRKRTQNGVIRYLKGIIENESYKNGSAYYSSPYVFIYLITKAYSDGKVKEFKPYLSNIKEYLLKTQNPDGGWGEDINTSMATNALINIGYRGNELEKAIGHILYTQENDGSWDLYSVYTQPGNPIIYFGSKELTTSFSLEALIKTRVKNRHNICSK